MTGDTVCLVLGVRGFFFTLLRWWPLESDPPMLCGIYPSVGDLYYHFTPILLALFDISSKNINSLSFCGRQVRSQVFFYLLESLVVRTPPCPL